VGKHDRLWDLKKGRKIIKNLFEKALSIDPPWSVREICFEEEENQLEAERG